MAELPEYRSNHPLTRGPQSSVSPAEVADPFNKIEQGLGAVADTFYKRDLNRAAHDGANNGVWRDKDGTLHLDQRSDLTETGRIYNAQAEQGYMARIQNDIRTNGLKLKNDSLGNPDTFRSSWDSYRDQTLSAVPDSIRGSVQQSFDALGPEFALGVSEEKRKRDIAVFANDIDLEKKSLLNEMAQLAYAGGTDSAGFKSRFSQLKTLTQQQVNNPDFALSQKAADIMLRGAHDHLMAEAMRGTVVRTLETGGLQAAMKLSDSIMTDQSLNLSPAERNAYKGQMDESIRDWQAQQQSIRKPLQEWVRDQVPGLKQGIGINNPDIDARASALEAAGDFKTADDLRKARAAGRFKLNFNAADNKTQVDMAEKALGDADKPAGGDVVDRIINIESGGNPNAKNPKSSAAGLGQFIDSTWLSMIHKYRPDLAEGKTASEIIAMKSDGELSKEMTGRYVQENTDFLRNQGVAPSDGDVYLAHFLGPRGAAQVIKGDPGAAISTIVDPSVIDANPFMRGKTVAEVRAWADKKMDGSGEALDPASISIVRSEVTKDLNDSYDGWEKTLRMGYKIESGSIDLISRQLAITDDQDTRQKFMELFTNAAKAGALDDVPPAERDRLMSAWKATASQGTDLAQAEGIRWVESARKAKDDAIKANPIGYGIDRGMIPNVQAFDPAAPDTWPGAFQDRQHAVDFMQNREGLMNLSALPQGDQQQIASLWQQGDPQKLSGLTNALATGLDPETLRATLSSGPVKEALKGAVLSTDPVKYGEAMKQLDLLANNGKTSMLDLQTDFGEEAVNRLQDWQGMVRYYTAEETQKWLQQRNDPSWQERTRPLVSKGEEEARKVSVSAIVSKLNSNWFGTVAPIDEQQQRMLQNDFVRQTGMRNASVNDPAKSQEQAIEKLKKVWGVTSVYGNTRGRLMPYPPEGFYPEIGNSHDWIGKELSGIAASHNVPMDNISLIADGKTKAAIDNKQQPGYMISVVNPETGMEELMTDDHGRPIRHFFDPKAAQVNATLEAAEARRTRNDPWLVLGPDFNIGPAFMYPGADPADSAMVKQRTKEIYDEQISNVKERRAKVKASTEELDKLGVPGDPFGGQ